MTKIKPSEKYTDQYENWFGKNIYVYQSEVNAIKEIFFISGFQNPRGSIGPGLSSQTTYHSFLQKGQVTFKL